MKKLLYKIPALQIAKIAVERGFEESIPGSSEGTGEDLWDLEMLEL